MVEEYTAVLDLKKSGDWKFADRAGRVLDDDLSDVKQSISNMVREIEEKKKDQSPSVAEPQPMSDIQRQKIKFFNRVRQEAKRLKAKKDEAETFQEQVKCEVDGMELLLKSCFEMDELNDGKPLTYGEMRARYG